MFREFENQREPVQPREKGLELKGDVATTACSLGTPVSTAASAATAAYILLSRTPHLQPYCMSVSEHCLESFNEAHKDLLRLSGNENSDVIFSEQTWGNLTY